MFSDNLESQLAAFGLVQASEGSRSHGAGIGDLHGLELGHGLPFQFSPMIPDPLPLGIRNGQAAKLAARARDGMSHLDGASRAGVFTRSWDDLGDLPVVVYARFNLVPGGAGRIVVVLNHYALAVRKAAGIVDHPLVERDGILAEGHLLRQFDVVRVGFELLDQARGVEAALPVGTIAEILPVVVAHVPYDELGGPMLVLVSL